ncbi:hypothetical protein [Nostoc sp. FACHB-888]|uniref:hypothetical protein n=1 Tax=Nostoc sp. FACHB-888 TaxID=2692842 RepID=UPI0019C4C48E|nr:hypothetical protein [Nostoc sp. FACHB-888]MBD2247388.1 hypothetical protein [Nostoc sp. FACHB-888]
MVLASLFRCDSTGTDREIALLFTVSGLSGFIVTVMAMRTRSYRKLLENYQKS